MEKTKTAVESSLRNLGEWHHSIELGFGVRTAPQQNNYDPMLRWSALSEELPEDLQGASVLDLGCNSGFMSVQMKKRGAGRVVSVDVAEHYLKQAQFLADWFEVEIEFLCKDVHVFCLTCEERFDYVIFMGLFYHLKYPVLVLDRVAEMAKQKLFFQTVLLDSNDIEKQVKEDLTWDDLSGEIMKTTFPRMHFIEHKFESDWSNWWVCNQSAISALLRNTGMDFCYDPLTSIFVCSPSNVRGKVEISNGVVFPSYGKVGITFPPS